MELTKDAKIFTRSSQTMPELASGSVRLLFSSPPFERMTKCCGETECLASHSSEAFVERFSRFLAERLRVLSDDGNYVLNFQPQVIDGFSSPTEYLLPRAVVAAGLKLVQTHVWAKPNAAPFAPDRRLKPAFEYCWHFAKSDHYFFNKDEVREAHAWVDQDKRSERYHALGKDPGNVFFLSKSQDQTSLGHPGKMKDGVASRFIKLLSAPGDLVVDGFVGAGQTGVEAMTLGRNFVGYELHEGRADQARERLGIGEDMVITKTWMNAKEVAVYTGLALPTVYSKSSRGEMPVHRGSGLPRYQREEIDRWMRGEIIPQATINQPVQSSANPS
jgi:DNA modification methylase